MEQLEAIERRRRNLRIVLFVIILATLPFYCVGILLWGSAPPRAPRTTATIAATLPSQALATATRAGLPSITPLGNTVPTLASTPGQFFTPFPVTRFLSPTPLPATATDFVFPTSTTAPTLTPAPTLTFAPPDTPIPIPSNTPIPIATDTPIPDSDGDGVPDNLDACPFTPAPPPTGCPPTTEPVLGQPPLPSETVIPPGS